jgi:hypothetical protein
MASATGSGTSFVTLFSANLGSAPPTIWLVTIRCLAWTGYGAGASAAAEQDLIISFDGANAHVGNVVAANYTGTAQLNVSASGNVITIQAGGVSGATYNMVVAASVQAQ